MITVSEELRQRITAKSSNVSRYQARMERFRQNNLFKNNKGRFNDELNGATEANVVPDQESTIDFGVRYGVCQQIMRRMLNG